MFLTPRNSAACLLFNVQSVLGSAELLGSRSRSPEGFFLEALMTLFLKSGQSWDVPQVTALRWFAEEHLYDSMMAGSCRQEESSQGWGIGLWFCLELQSYSMSAFSR